jgi:hypothetical protein
MTSIYFWLATVDPRYLRYQLQKIQKLLGLKVSHGNTTSGLAACDVPREYDLQMMHIDPTASFLYRVLNVGISSYPMLKWLRATGGIQYAGMQRCFKVRPLFNLHTAMAVFFPHLVGQ